MIFHNCHHSIKGAHEKSPCTICGDMITKYGKNQHFKEKHPDSDLCICQNCGQKFHTTESLRKHIEYKHLDVGDFPCPWVWKQCYKR